jgi:hypothetical protein
MKCGATLLLIMSLALTATSAMAADIHITEIVPEHARPGFDGMTEITLTFSNGTTDHYTMFSDRKGFTPQEAANLAANEARVRTWRVGDSVEFLNSADCFLGSMIADISKNPPSVVCFQ